ncbi:MAG: hypothetical protein WD894_09860 [Pirellulales bacterium]
MTPIRITGHIDEKHYLVATVPESVPPGPVTVLIVPIVDEDEAGQAWLSGIAHEWAEDLADVRQDIYTLEDGEPVGAD